jgi:hypothetical protein
MSDVAHHMWNEQLTVAIRDIPIDDLNPAAIRFFFIQAQDWYGKLGHA